LGRIIKSSSAGKDRISLEKGIVIAIRELVKKTTIDETTYDILAFISLSLNEIGETVDQSVAAWEKRGYWVKADRYRMKWNWSSILSVELKQAILTNDWEKVASILAHISQKLGKVTISMKNKAGSPWTGCYQSIRPEKSH
jgi:hypothetical protein